jgi:NADH-quinone oxidoreductase subunit L
LGRCWSFSYLLIGFWHKNQDFNDAAKSLYHERIGDLGLLIGIFIIGSLFSTLDYATLKRLSQATDLDMYWISAAAFIFIGACGISSSIYIPGCQMRWQVLLLSALIHAATMVTAGIFMITRLNYLFDLAPDVQNIIAIIGRLLVAATIALVQTDIKSTCLLYRFSIRVDVLSFRTWRIRVAVFHVITHAFFKASLFLGYSWHGEQDMRKMGGLKR